MFKFKKEVVWRISHADLEDIFNDHYNWSSCCIGEVANDSVHTFNVTTVIDEFDKTMLAYIKADDEHFISIDNVGILLDDLCEKGKIESGEYLVEVSW